MSCQLTILMAVRNGIPFLQPAMESILGQTYQDFQFLIVDDASTDETREIIKSYNDRRIRLLCLDQNVGQTAALNEGLRKAETPWIARMDADDYSAPERMEKQMAVLASTKDIDCLGTFAWTFRSDPAAADGEITTQINHDDIKRALLGGSPLIHGTIVVSRTAMLDVGVYDAHYRYSADVEMYDRLLSKYKAAAIPELLLGVRRHSRQGSRTERAFDENIEIFARRLGEGGYSSDDAATIRRHLSRYHVVRSHYYLGKGLFGRAGADLRRAWQISPGSFSHSCARVFGVGRIPAPVRNRLRRLLKTMSPRRER